MFGKRWDAPSALYINLKCMKLTRDNYNRQTQDYITRNRCQLTNPKSNCNQKRQT